MTVVDTHAWLWLVAEPRRLGRHASQLLDQARRIGVPAICCLEVAVLAVRGRILLDRPSLEWMNAALALPRMELLGLTPAVATKAALLPDTFPGDPADRLVVATALLEAAPLVTKDRRIRRSGAVETVW